MTPSDPLPDLSASNKKRICVIGAGANGLAVLKVFADSPRVQSGDWVISCYEEREDVGGIWCVDHLWHFAMIDDALL